MKNPSSELHQLILSLSKHDKIYLKVFLRKRGIEGLPVELFNLISAQETYDEAAIRERLSESYNVRSFAQHKLRLYDAILESLRIRRAGATQHEVIDIQIANVECLIEKGLFAQANKLLRNTLKLAEEIEYHTAMLEMLIKQRRILQHKQERGVAEKIIKSLADSEASLMAHEREQRYQMLYDRMLLYSRFFYKQRRPEDIAAMQILIQSPLLLDESLAVTFYCRVYFYAIHARYHRLHNRNGEVCKFRLKLVELWENNPERKRDNFLGSLKALANLANSCLLCDPIDNQLLNTTLTKIRALKPANITQDVEKYQSETHINLLQALNSCSLDDVVNDIPAIEQGLRKFDDYLVISRKLAISYNIAAIYFIREQYNEALKWILKIMHEYKTDSRQDIQLMAQVLFAVIHFSLGSHASLEMLLRKIHDYFNRKRPSLDFEKKFIGELKQLVGAVTERDREAVYLRLCNQLRATAAGPPESHFLGLRELLFWFESRVQKRPMAKVFAEYNARRNG